MEILLADPRNIALVLTSVVALASSICAVTPTVKDDEVVKKYGDKIGKVISGVYKFVEVLALNIGKAKEPSKADEIRKFLQIPAFIKERFDK